MAREYEMLRRLLQNQYVVSVLNQGVHIVLGLFNSILINRFLGPSLKGEYAYVLNIVNMLAIVLNLGIYQSYSFYRRKGIPNIKEKYVDIFFMQFILYMLIGLGLSLFFQKIHLIVIFTLTPIMVFSSQLGFITLVENINLRNVLSMLSSVLYSLSLLLVYLYASARFSLIAGLLYFQEISFLLLLIIMFRFRLHLNLKNIDYRLLKGTIAFGIYPMLVSILTALNYRVDILILKLFVSFEELGYYTLGVGLATNVWIVPDAFKQVLFARTARSDSVRDILLSIKTTLYIEIIAFMTIILAGKPLIVLLYGSQFIPAYTVTVVIFAGIIPMAFYKLITALFLAKGKQQISFRFLFISAVVNVGANFAFIPRFGIIGSALASVISYGACSGMFLYEFMKDYQLAIKDVLVLNREEMTRIGSLFRRKEKMAKEFDMLNREGVLSKLTPEMLQAIVSNPDLMDLLKDSAKAGLWIGSGKQSLEGCPNGAVYIFLLSDVNIYPNKSVWKRSGRMRGFKKASQDELNLTSLELARRRKQIQEIARILEEGEKEKGKFKSLKDQIAGKKEEIKNLEDCLLALRLTKAALEASAREMERVMRLFKISFDYRNMENYRPQIEDRFRRLERVEKDIEDTEKILEKEKTDLAILEAELQKSEEALLLKLEAGKQVIESILQ